MISFADHEAITRQVYLYGYGMDQQDWEGYRQLFDDEVVVDYSSYSGGEPAVVPTEQWIARLQSLFPGLDATQHSMTNPLVDLADDGDTARCRIYVQAAHFLNDWPEPEFTIGGYYDHRLRRTSDGWRFREVKLTVWWRRGDPELMVEARRRAAAA